MSLFTDKIVTGHWSYFSIGEEIIDRPVIIINILADLVSYLVSFLGNHSGIIIMSSDQQRFKMSRVMECRSDFTLPCFIICGTLELSVNHLTCCLMRKGHNCISILCTADSSRHVELLAFSIGDHVLWQQRLNFPGTYPPKPVSLPSEICIVGTSQNLRGNPLRWKCWSLKKRELINYSFW